MDTVYNDRLQAAAVIPFSGPLVGPPIEFRLVF